MLKRRIERETVLNITDALRCSGRSGGNHTMIKRFLSKLMGEWRLLWGFCPVCNSDAPKIDKCQVCFGYGKMHNDVYPPTKTVKEQWRKLWKRMDSI